MRAAAVRRAAARAALALAGLVPLALATAAAPPVTPVTAPNPAAAARPAAPAIQPAQATRQAPRGPRKMQITLQAPATNALGTPLVLEVTLANPGAAPIAIDDPAQSLEIEYHLVDQQTQEDLSFTLGRTTSRLLGSDDRYAIEAPMPKPVTIAPRGTLAVQADANLRLFLRPGDYLAYVSHQDSESNRVPVKVAYTRESVSVLFATAHDPKTSHARREWAGDRLARLFPDFRLSLPLPDEPADVRAKREADNQPVYVRFAAWWRDQLATPDLDERLQKLR